MRHQQRHVEELHLRRLGMFAFNSYAPSYHDLDLPIYRIIYIILIYI